MTEKMKTTRTTITWKGSQKGERRARKKAEEKTNGWRKNKDKLYFRRQNKKRRMKGWRWKLDWSQNDENRSNKSISIEKTNETNDWGGGKSKKNDDGKWRADRDKKSIWSIYLIENRSKRQIEFKNNENVSTRVEGWRATDGKVRTRFRRLRQRHQWRRATEYKQTHRETLPARNTLPKQRMRKESNAKT